MRVSIVIELDVAAEQDGVLAMDLGQLLAVDAYDDIVSALDSRQNVLLSAPDSARRQVREVAVINRSVLDEIGAW